MKAGVQIIHVLTVLPKSWSIRKIEENFGATNFMVITTKDLVTEHGTMSSPSPKLGKSISQEIADIVQSFYNSDAICRPMPGKETFCVLQKRMQKSASVKWTYFEQFHMYIDYLRRNIRK